MRAIANKKIGTWLALVVASAVLALTGSTASAAPVSINLCAVTGTATLTGSVTVPIWGFVPKGVAPNCGALQGTATLPGPVLTVNEGDAVTINVTNALPTGHAITFEIPGVSFAPGPTDAAVGATVTRSFTVITSPGDTDPAHTKPGTYLYQSGGDAGRQEAMGLYGALIVRSATALQAYDVATTAYNVEAPLVLSQVDPAFNNCSTDPNPPCSSNPNNFDMTKYLATYWLINGKAYPDTARITASAGQRVLLRYLNAGYDNTTMMVLGMHEQVLARDARLLNNPFGADAETIPAGATEDAIATVPSFAGPGTAGGLRGFPLYNRQLHLTNGAPGAPPGGMLTFIGP